MFKRLFKKPLAMETELNTLNSEFLESGFRSLMYTIGVILLAIYLLANLFDSKVDIPRISTVVLVMAFFSWLAIQILSKNLFWAQLTWLGGCFLAITLVVYYSGISSLVYLYLILPIMAATLMGWEFGLVVTVVMVVLFWFVPTGQLIPVLPDYLILITMIIGAVSTLVTSTYLFSLQTFYQWSYGYYQLARVEIDKTQDQRVDFLEIQEDLVLANKELKRMTDQLDVLYQRAEEARRVKEEFVANVSHELRTPLNMIIGFSDVIMKNPRLYGDKIPSALLADISSIHRNSQHLSRLVNDVLDLSQVEANRMAITKEWTSVESIILEAIGAVQALYDSKGLYLISEIPDQSPPVFCDSTRLRQVVINLLSNAGRYTKEGGVTVKAGSENDNLVIAVTDTGPGIPEEDQDKLFQPFQQLGEPSNREGGSGLGLTISKQFVEMHDGNMWLESEIGIGTTFFVSIPFQTMVKQENSIDSDWLRYLREEGQVEVRSRHMKISSPVVKPLYILVEQGVALQRLFERYMDDVEVISRDNIKDAVEEMRGRPFQALILNSPESPSDLDGKNGLEKLPLGTPVYSCWVPGRDEVARQLGVVDYLLKPVTQDEIVSAIESLENEIKSILLVDDETELLQLFARMLSSARPECKIFQAFDGQRALSIMRSRHPDVILLDLIMPGLDGFQILREKSRDETIRNIPVIVVSSINPTGETIISNNLTITRKEGLSVHDLIGSIQSINKVLNQS